MIPLKDLTPRQRFPIITLLLIAANIAVFAHQVSLPPKASESFVKRYALTPYNIQQALAGHRYTLDDALVPVVTCMFLHAGLLHIAGNMLFLWVFGGNVEDRFGAIGYLIFYFVCGIGSGLTQLFFSWGSHIPSLGASGAISGVLGAYIVLFPTSRILTLVPLLFFWFLARIRAVFFIGLWFLIQFLSGLGSLSSASTGGGVAWWAHIGGFLIGVIVALPVRVVNPKPSW